MNADAALSACGLSGAELGLLRAVLAQCPGLTRARLFGSRATGAARCASDIDIAVEGPATRLQVEAARDRLNELPLPYVVDVQALEDIKNAALREHIARCGLVLFERREEGPAPPSPGG